MYACLFRRMYCYFSFFTNLESFMYYLSIYYCYYITTIVTSVRRICVNIYIHVEKLLSMYLLTDTEINRCHPT